MNIISDLIHSFFSEQIQDTGIILVISLFINFCKINVISYITANIIEFIQEKKIKQAFTYFYYFVIVSILYIVLYSIYNILQNKLLSRLRQWIRNELVKRLLIINNENFSDINFTKLNSPILRISNTTYYVFNTIITTLIPNLTLLILVFFYFVYKDIQVGIIFLLGNILVCIYLYSVWNVIIDHNKKYEEQVSENESYLVEILNNIDKIIFRGNIVSEIDTFTEKSEKTIQSSLQFFYIANFHELVMNIFAFITIFICLYYMLMSFISKTINMVSLMTCLTILLLYRDVMISSMEKVPDFFEFVGRSDSIINIFNKMNIGNPVVHSFQTQSKQNTNLLFDTIRFENVTFKYKKNQQFVFDHFNIQLNTTNKIIGIVGLSGKGKSTFAKLLIKMYKIDDGNIYIDNIIV